MAVIHNVLPILPPLHPSIAPQLRCRFDCPQLDAVSFYLSVLKFCLLRQPAAFLWAANSIRHLLDNANSPPITWHFTSLTFHGTCFFLWKNILSVSSSSNEANQKSFFFLFLGLFLELRVYGGEFTDPFLLPFLLQKTRRVNPSNSTTNRGRGHVAFVD